MKKILYVGSEVLPFASTGGLADVLGSLPAAVAKKLGDGGDVRVVLPMYKSVKEKFLSNMTREYETYISLAWRWQYCGIWSLCDKGVKYYFIDNEYYFCRGPLYGEYDDAERFAFFCKAVMEMMNIVDFHPDVLHANDWQSALTVIYLKRKYNNNGAFANTRAVYTIHNIGYQGRYGFDILGDVFELSEADKEIVEFGGDINLTKGAIVCADKVTTVSPRYAEEIMTDYYSEGLSPVLNMYRFKTCGIINGIDIDYYNPQTDTEIPANYSVKSFSGKAADKKELQERCGLEVRKDVPIIAMVSRLASHKGFDLVRYVLEEILANDVQFVLLGTGEHELENFFRYIANKYPGKVSINLAYDKAFSKLIYAGSDIFLMPSLSEPCGLSQMIASRYGTVPVVRETGGLFDTIKPYNKFDGSGNGFTFANYNAHEMKDAVMRAVELYHDEKEWKKFAKHAMEMDFSWNASAEKYLRLYDDLT